MNKKRRIQAALRLAKADTKRVKNLSDKRDQAEFDLQDAMRRYRRFPKDGDFRELMAIDEETAVASQTKKEAEEDIRNAPFDMAKLLRAAVLKHGKPKYLKRKKRRK